MLVLLKGVFMTYAVGMGLGAMKYISRFIKICSDVQKLVWAIHINRQEVIS
jgi:hypothetical protein